MSKDSAGNALYVGEGFKLDRIRGHISDPLKTEWFPEISIVEVRAADVTKSQSLALEQDLVHELKPRYICLQTSKATQRPEYSN